MISNEQRKQDENMFVRALIETQQQQEIYERRRKKQEEQEAAQRLAGKSQQHTKSGRNTGSDKKKDSIRESKEIS